MKRCPKCNRAYQTDTQKFCTHDGGLLFAIDPSLSETVQFDSTQVRDAVSKPTTRDLADQKPAAFDPEATVVTGSRTQEGTKEAKGRDTQDLEPSQSLPQTSLPIEGSGPIQQPTSSAPLPPAQTSVPIATSAPLPSQPAFQPSHPQAAPRAKKSKLPLVLGILAVLFVLGIGVLAAAYFVVVRPMLAARKVERTTTTEPVRTNPSVTTSESTPTEVSQPITEVPAYVPPANAVEFVNSKDNLDGKLLEHYLDFSFYYPNTWQKDPTAGVSGASNFAKVERRIPPDFTQENFAVGWFSSSGSAATDSALFPNLAENMSAQLQPGFPEYRKVSEGPTKAGVYDGYEFRFEAMSRNTAKGDIRIWGRVIFVSPPNGGQNGATILLLATSLASELNSVDDIGEKGELPMLLQSFRFGKQ